MSYKNAKEILPDYLITEIQKYINGEIIYIPKHEEKKIKWGTKNGSRKKYDIRNGEIRALKGTGLTVEEIAVRYFLSTESVKKILSG
jgi:DNA-binding NarL/FixJ family response regulator